jgi:hypothetical protein
LKLQVEKVPFKKQPSISENETESYNSEIDETDEPEAVKQVVKEVFETEAYEVLDLVQSQEFQNEEILHINFHRLNSQIFDDDDGDENEDTDNKN